MAVFNEIQVSEAVQNNRFSAEFFDPRYVFTPADGREWKPIGRLLERCQYGLSVAMNNDGKGFPIFRMNEIADCFAQRPSKYANVPQFVFDLMSLHDGDVLFNRTNSFEFVGRTGMVKGRDDRTFASYLIRLVLDANRLLPEFLTVYLNTSFGIGQVKRRAMRSINQANVSGSEIRKVQIPLIDILKQQSVADILNSAHALGLRSENLYTTACQQLASQLGLTKLMFKKPLGYQARFSELELSRRADAQHFQPRFTALLKHLESFPTAKLRNLKRLNRRGVQPIYFSEGSIAVVNSQHLGPRHISYSGLQRTSKAFYDASPAAHIRRDDLLIYATGAYIGRTNVYLDDSPALASNHVSIVRLRPGIDAAYMSLVMQSVIGQFQTQKHARGSTQAELYPSDIDKFVVPLLPIDTQNAIGDLLRESLRKQLECKSLIEEAKACVGLLIQEAVKS